LLCEYWTWHADMARHVSTRSSNLVKTELN
jgi:hypothetical protein